VITQLLQPAVNGKLINFYPLVLLTIARCDLNINLNRSLMKKFYLILSGLILAALSAFGQSYLNPQEGHKVAYFFSDIDHIQTLDVGTEFFYFCDGDTIYQADPDQRLLSNKYGLPADYNLLTFSSFLCLSPDESTLWAAYTDLDNVDARIYSIDVGSGTWSLEARMPANWDLAFWNDSILVSGLNSADFDSPNAIYVLDTSGGDQHRLIIETGGSSAGLAVDSHGDLYFGTSSFTDPNALYRWDSAQLAAVIESPAAAPLQLGDAVKLSDLPTGAYDCEVDAADNLVFTMNTWGGTQVIGSWNNISGDGYNYDTLATSSHWLGMVKSRGDYTVPIAGNSLFTLGYDQAVADLHTGDYPPVLIAPLPVITGYESDQIGPLDLSLYMTDLDDPDWFDFVMTYISEPSVATLSIEGAMLTGSFGLAGQANLAIVATNAGGSVRAETVIGTWPEAEAGLLVSTFGELSLDPESYWNGSDETGEFTSGPARFFNAYSSEYFTWSGWAYSNTSDVSTAGFTNQYSAFTGEGFHGPEEYNQVYAVSNLYGPSLIDFTAEKAHAVDGFFVTNSSYTALSMLEGDMFAKAFGGVDGSDPDYFKLLVWGMAKGKATDSVEFHLADYRFDNAAEDYIIKTWQWVDLSSLGKVDSLMFGLESSDNGDWGMNTPAYFCLDNLMVHPDGAPYVANPMGDLSIISNDSAYVFDISEVFSDPDDADSAIVKAVKSNSNEDILSASIAGDELTLSGRYSSLKNVNEEVELVLEGSLGGLAALDTVLVSLEYPSGIEDDPLAHVRIYPNPSQGQFVIGSESGEVLDVSIYSITGTKVYTNRHLLSGESIDLNAQAAGAYIVRIQNRSGVISKMIQIQ